MGNEFKQLLQDEHHAQKKPMSVKNPQANAMLERAHQVPGNSTRTFELENRPMDRTDPWTGILSAVAWAVRSTHHTTLQATPGQLMFG